MRFFISTLTLAMTQVVLSQHQPFTTADYTKTVAMIPMRDGVKLYTTIYSPKDTSEKWPILLERTPYGHNYTEGVIPRVLGPTLEYTKEGYIFVDQDVRGRYMSEGTHVFSPPHNPKKTKPTDHDESSDAYDTIAWLIKNVPNNSGKVGIMGISQPGFYASNALLDAHPNLVCASPQAPVTDRWIGDDCHHNGAFFLAQRFSFMSSFGAPRPEPTSRRAPGYRMPYPDAYRFFLETGSNANIDKLYFKGENKFWQWVMAHPDYDDFWKSRGMQQHFKNIKPAVLTVGGWFDAEDLFGALKTYGAIESQSRGTSNRLVMGPWRHGGWAGGTGAAIGNLEFGTETATYFRNEIELPFFRHYLKGAPDLNLAEATIFETGGNKWHKFDRWPPRNSRVGNIYLGPKGSLGWTAPQNRVAEFDEYLSDPAKPVPYTQELAGGMVSSYMYEDQRFVSTRPDVLIYRGPELKTPVTLAGPMRANIWVSTSGTDSDFIVKLIDVYPDSTPNVANPVPSNFRLAGAQMLVRAEVMRAKYRSNPSKPSPMSPNKPTLLSFELQDVCHTFKAGHRIMVQVQSSWFPLVDRNPQTFVANINTAKEADFKKATQKLYRSTSHQSRIQVTILN